MNVQDLNYMYITLKNIDKIDIAFYYDSKKHRFDLSINYGEKYLNVTRKEALAIFNFLKVLKQISRNSNKTSTKDHNRKSVRESSDEEIFDIGPSKESSTPKVDKTDIEDEWDTFEKDQLANEEF